MRKRPLIAAAMAGILLVAGSVTWHTLAGSEEELPHYSFIVTQTEEGIELVCRENCAWKKLSHNCGGKLPCSAVVDEHGIRGAQELDRPANP